MKILHTSDWHHDARTAGVPRAKDVEAAVWQTVRVAIDRKVDVYAFTGDLADPEDCPAALAAVQFAIEIALHLRARKIMSWWMAGNHCVIEDGSGRTVLSPLRALEPINEIAVFEYPYVLKDCMGCTVCFLPFTASSHTYDPVEALKPAQALANPRTVVLSHLNVPGIVPGEETNEMPRGRDVWLPIQNIDPAWTVLQGHYHRQQRHVVDGRIINVCGSLARLTFGEESNQPSFQIVEV